MEPRKVKMFVELDTNNYIDEIAYCLKEFDKSTHITNIALDAKDMMLMMEGYYR